MTDPGPPDRAARLFLESIRLDLRGVEAVLEEARPALDEGVGGFILFGGTAGEARTTVETLREEAGRPLWFAADLERGAGQQFEGASALPPPAGLAAHPEPEAAVREAASLTAREARRIGINLVFAPVLDLNVEATNPIVGTRSFGADPGQVGELGAAWVEACQREGVAACGKHFPGHGRTTADSHTELPTVEADRGALEADLRPFRRVSGEVASVMTAHVRYPALGADGPATLERAVLRDLLRDEMGFEGLVVTDALVMEALADERAGAATEGWLAVRALRAGCDLLLYPRDLAQSARTVRQAVRQDPYLEEDVGAALRRSDGALERYGGAGPTDGEGAPAGPDEDAERLARECVVAPGPDPRGLLEPGRRLGVHVVDDDPPPPEAEEEARTAEAFPAARAFRETLTAAGWEPAPREDDPGAGTEEQRVVLVASSPRAGKGRAALSDGARAEARRLVGAGAVPVVFGGRRILESLGGEGVCAWSPDAVMGRAAARWLTSGT